MSLSVLSPPDLDAALALQQAALDDAAAGFLRNPPAAELLQYLDGTAGAAFGIRAEGALRALALLRLPTPERPNAGTPFPLVPVADWPHHAAFLENAIVHPAWRGRGFQRGLIAVRQARARRAGMRWICAGVRIENLASWRNLLGQGLLLAGLRDDGGRVLMGLLGAAEPGALATDGAASTRVPLADLAGHRQALAGGHLGVGWDAAAQALIYRRRRLTRA